MEKTEMVQKVVAVDVAFGTFVAILQDYPEEGLTKVDIYQPRRFFTGFLRKISQAISFCFKGIVLRSINSAVARSVAQVRVVKNIVKTGK